MVIMEGLQRHDFYNGTKINGLDYYYMLREFDKATVEVG